MGINEHILKIDKECSKHLKKGVIVNENSFTAILTIKIYEQLHEKGVPCYAKVLPRNQEEKYGCDAIIVIKEEYGYCVGFWEAKLPRKGVSWDRLHNGVSHFKKQIAIQNKNKLCSWEVFYNDGSISDNTFVNTLESSLCVWRDDIETFQNNNSIKLWNNKHLRGISNKGKNFADILKDMALCIRNKQVINKSDYVEIITEENKTTVPIYKSKESQREIADFMIRNGLISYIYLDNSKKVENHESPGNMIRVRGLLRSYSLIMKELKDRNIVRTANNPVADYAEFLVSDKLGLELVPNSMPGYDAVNKKTGIKYQIKARKGKSRQLGVIRNLKRKQFYYLIAIFFDEEFNVTEAYEISSEEILNYARLSEHQNGHILRVKDIIADGKVKDITQFFK